MSREAQAVFTENRKYFAGIILVLAIFIAVWAWVVVATAPWGDENFHLAAAAGLHYSGKADLWDIDKNKISDLTDNQDYNRGQIITRPTAFLMKISLNNMLLFHIIPLFFSLLTLGFWAWYAGRRMKFGLGAVMLLSIFILGQPIFLEEAAYLRAYSALGLFMSVAVIGLWEAREGFIRKRWAAVMWGGLAVMMAIVVPQLDHWQSQHILAIIFSALLLHDKVWQRTQKFLSNPRKVAFVAVPLLLLAPFAVIVIDQMMVGIKMGSRPMPLSFVTYWDNIAGLLRFMLALNVCLIGFKWLAQGLVKRSFWSWLYVSGILSGIFLALFLPLSHIFYSRFFYIHVLLGSIGFLGLFLEKNPQPGLRRAMIAGYLVIGICFSGINFYYDRDNRQDGVVWLKENLKKNDILFAFSPQYMFNNGEELIGRTYFIGRSADLEKVEEIIRIAQNPGTGRIFFFCADFYQFKNRLYHWTTGGDRIFKYGDEVNYIYYAIPSESVLRNPRGFDIRIYDAAVLAEGLKTLREEGFAERIPPVSMHKKLIKGAFGAFNLPTKREDILEIPLVKWFFSFFSRQ